MTVADDGRGLPDDSKTRAPRRRARGRVRDVGGCANEPSSWAAGSTSRPAPDGRDDVRLTVPLAGDGAALAVSS